MTIVHVVLFEFKPSTELATVQDICTRMLALKTKCVHPTTQKQYILEASVGRDNSIEGLQGGISHGFVVHFENEADREYYVTKDPAHLAFVKSLEGMVERVVVVDYAPGVF